MNYTEVEFGELKGKVFSNVYVSDTDECIIFECEDGTKYHQLHSQSCCENVYLDSIDGYLSSIIGYEILLAEEVSNDEEYAGYYQQEDDDAEHYSWTFYKLATCKGYVTIRWYGSSNGFYSETADLYRIEED